MPRLSASRVRHEWADALNRVAHKGERISVIRYGKVTAALVSPEDLELLELLEDRMDLEEARASLAEVAKHGSTPWAKIKAVAGV